MLSKDEEMMKLDLASACKMCGNMTGCPSLLPWTYLADWLWSVSVMLFFTKLIFLGMTMCAVSFVKQPA